MPPMSSTPYTCIWSSYERIGNDPVVFVNEFMARMKMGKLKKIVEEDQERKKDDLKVINSL